MQFRACTYAIMIIPHSLRFWTVDLSLGLHAGEE